MGLKTALALVLVLAAAPAGAAWEPTKPIEFVVPAGTGGGADQMARLISGIAEKHKLSPRPIIVVKSGEFEFLDQFDFSRATARISRDELVVEGIVVRDKATQRQKTINARFRWFTSPVPGGPTGSPTTCWDASLRSSPANPSTSFFGRGSSPRSR